VQAGSCSLGLDAAAALQDIELADDLFKTSGKPTSRAQSTTQGPLSPTELLKRSQRRKPSPLGDLASQRLELEHSRAWLMTQAPRSGITMTLLDMRAYDPTTLTVTWEATLPWQGMCRELSELPKLNAMFVANLHQVALLDMDTGRLLWSSDMNAERGPWSSIASNGFAVYVLYIDDTEVNVGALPLSTPPAIGLP
ncbi:MAG: hypothetical protein AAFX99_22195, partial [Myxococcota bacterium]